MFQNPSNQYLCNFLKSVKTIAVVGLSPNPERPSYEVSRAMQAYGFKIIPIRPGADKILGEKAYASISEVPDSIDLVNVFRAASYVPDVVQECLEASVKAIWIQLGIVNDVAARYAREQGMMTVMDLCIYQFYSRNCR